MMQIRPAEVLPFFEQGAKEALRLLLTAENQDALSQTTIPDFQVMFKSEQSPLSLRSLTAEHVNSLIKVYLLALLPINFSLYGTVLCVRCRASSSLLLDPSPRQWKSP